MVSQSGKRGLLQIVTKIGRTSCLNNKNTRIKIESLNFFEINIKLKKHSTLTLTMRIETLNLSINNSNRIATQLV